MRTTKISSRVLNELAKRLPADRTKKNEPLALHTYIKLGGPAEVFTVAKSADELAGAVSAAEELDIPWFILGGGSNILVGDLGIRGLVIKNEARKITANSEQLTAESGVLMSRLAAFAIERGLSGLEMFMSVPGTLGGAIFNNSHYRPQKNEFIGNLVEEAEILIPRRRLLSDARISSTAAEPESTAVRSDASHPARRLDSIKRKIVDKKWFRFRYDYSRLQDEKAVVLRVKFGLHQESSEVLRERSLALMRQRNQRQPIGSPSCGCMFKNPLRIEGSDPAPLPGSDPSRISAGKLIDEAGMKGIKVGGVRVSETHANFLVNDGSGKVGDVLELMNRVKNRVKEIHGIELAPEIFFVGEFGVDFS